MTTYEITSPDGVRGARVEADYTRFDSDTGCTKLYRERRLLWDKCVHTSRAGDHVVAVIARAEPKIID